mgnify:CR=1 FL=1
MTRLDTPPTRPRERTAPLARQLDAQQTAERRTAAIALLRCPLIHSAGTAAGREGPDLLRLIQRHGHELRRWFLEYPGWPLRIDRRSARLIKHRVAGGTPHDATRGAADPKTARPLDRRRYALVLLILAALEHCEDQTLVSHVAELLAHMHGHAAELAGSGLALDFTLRDDREDVVHALRYLTHLGVLERIDGDEQSFVADRETGNALYNIHRDAAAAVLCTRAAPSLAQTQIQDAATPSPLARVVDDAPPDSADPRDPSDAQVLRRRQHLYRRLLDDPVVYFDQLPEDELAYLTNQRPHLLKNIEDFTGLPAEVRAEGIALLDVDGTATDAALPRESVVGHVTLLLAEHLAERRDAGHPRVGRAQLEAHVVGLIKTYGRHWRKDARKPGAETWLVRDALHLLRRLDLVRLHDAAREIEPRPAVTRYRVGEVRGLNPA